MTALICSIYGCMAPALWIWDHVTDPVGAQQTVLLRLSFLYLFLLGGAFLVVRSSRVLAWASMILLLVAPVILTVIFGRLNNGMLYGIGGYMHFQVTTILCFQCFSLSWGLTYNLTVAFLPHLLALIGFTHGFQHAQYAVLIWPATAATLMAQWAISENYYQRHSMEEALDLMSRTDPMTGVANRRHFLPLLAAEIRRAQRLNQPLSLLELDIDHFKQVNDTYGHLTGDAAIRLLADQCRCRAREIDVVARLGGEEFAVLLPGADLPQALAVAERIRALVEATPMKSPDSVEFHITVSIGVVQVGQDDEGENSLLARVDKALYMAKNTGRNRVCAVP